MGKLKDYDIPESFTLKVRYEISSLQRGDIEEEIARVLILDEIYDERTRDYLLGYVEDVAKTSGDNSLLLKLFYQSTR